MFERKANAVLSNGSFVLSHRTGWCELAWRTSPCQRVKTSQCVRKDESLLDAAEGILTNPKVDSSITKTFYSTSEIHHTTTLTDPNWYHAVNLYTTGIKCTLCKTSANAYKAQVEYSFHDFYNYELSDIKMGNMLLSPRDLWELHHGGLAQAFEVRGKNILEIKWVLHQRVESGANINDIS